MMARYLMLDLETVLDTSLPPLTGVHAALAARGQARAPDAYAPAQVSRQRDDRLVFASVVHFGDEVLDFVRMEIRDESTGDNLILGLYVEGTRTATAHVDGDVLRQMQAELGRPREEVAGDLRDALERLHANALEKVGIGPLREAPERSRRFIATYKYRDHREVTEGVVWYDVNSGTTGPEAVPPLVRNKLRYAVHEHLVKGNAAAEELLKGFR